MVKSSAMSDECIMNRLPVGRAAFDNLKPGAEKSAVRRRQVLACLPRRTVSLFRHVPQKLRRILEIVCAPEAI
jgi:hypothetical protein